MIPNRSSFFASDPFDVPKSEFRKENIIFTSNFKSGPYTHHHLDRIQSIEKTESLPPSHNESKRAKRIWPKIIETCEFLVAVFNHIVSDFETVLVGPSKSEFPVSV